MRFCGINMDIRIRHLELPIFLIIATMMTEKCLLDLKSSCSTGSLTAMKHLTSNLYSIEKYISVCFSLCLGFFKYIFYFSKFCISFRLDECTLKLWENSPDKVLPPNVDQKLDSTWGDGRMAQPHSAGWRRNIIFMLCN